MKRKLQRIFFHTTKFLVTLLVYINGRWYMKCFNPLLRSMGLKMTGVPRFISKSASFDDFDLITLGDRVVVSSHVTFLTHDYSYTTGLIAISKFQGRDEAMLGPIVIGNNVFIGWNTLILPGTTVGDNVIIGAGSVIRGKIPSNSVVAGNPAQVVSGIEEHTQKLMSKDYLHRVDS